MGNQIVSCGRFCVAASLLFAALALCACQGDGDVPFDDAAPSTGCDNLVARTTSGAEVGFLRVESYPFELCESGRCESFRAAEALLGYTFQPAKEQGKPLLVFFNGGPGSSTSGVLFAWNTSRLTVDPAITKGVAATTNTSDWSTLGNLLYLDARQTGFSVDLHGDAVPDSAEDAFQPYPDAADFVRAILSFIDAHPALASAPVVLVGESYGGVRSTVMLHMLHYPARYGAEGKRYRDAQLVAQIEALSDVSGRFRHQALIQPLVSGHQPRVSTELLTAADSPLREHFDSWDALYACDGDCDHYATLVGFQSESGRDMYHFAEDRGWGNELVARGMEVITDPDALKVLLAVDPGGVDLFHGRCREGCFRTDRLRAIPEATALDRFFGVETSPFIWRPRAFEPGGEFPKVSTNIHYQSVHDLSFGELFLEVLLRVETLITWASHDLLIYAPAIPESLRRHDASVASVEEEAQRLVVTYREGAFSTSQGEQRSIDFPYFEGAGHVVTVTHSAELRDAVGALMGR